MKYEQDETRPNKIISLFCGLYCLTHTPNPMSFLSKICKRPLSNKATLILAIGHADKNATIPYASKIKKPLKEVMSVIN